MRSCECSWLLIWGGRAWLNEDSIWSQKFCITEFYKRLTVHFWDKGYDLGLKIIRWSLLVTFAAVVISIFAECTPADKYIPPKPNPSPDETNC